jgi:hypothetical protein
MKSNLINLTKNKYVFYVVSLLAILNVLGYFSMRSWNCIVMFAAVAYATNCYANNKVIALLSGLFVANFVFGCNQVKENFVEALNPLEAVNTKLDDAKEDIKTEAKCAASNRKWDPEKGKCLAGAIDKVEDASKLITGANQLLQASGGPGGLNVEKMMSALTNMGK